MNLCNFWRQQEIFIHQPLIFTDICLQCLYVAFVFVHSFDIVKPKTLLPCLSFLINQWLFSTVLAHSLVPHSLPWQEGNRNPMERCWPRFTLGAAKPRSNRKQMRGGRRGSVWSQQLHSGAGNELVDIWESARRAAGHPEILGKCRGSLCSTHSKPDTGGCISLLHVQGLLRTIQFGMETSFWTQRTG